MSDSRILDASAQGADIRSSKGSGRLKKAERLEPRYLQDSRIRQLVRKNKMLMFLALTAKCRIQESYLRICAGATDIRSCKGLRPSEKVSDGLGPARPDICRSCTGCIRPRSPAACSKNKMLMFFGLNGQMSDSRILPTHLRRSDRYPVLQRAQAV